MGSLLGTKVTELGRCDRAHCNWQHDVITPQVVGWMLVTKRNRMVESVATREGSLDATSLCEEMVEVKPLKPISGRYPEEKLVSLCIGDRQGRPRIPLVENDPL